MEHTGDTLPTLWAAGLVAPVTDFVKELGGEKFIDPWALKGYQWDEQYWCIPYTMFTNHVTYRKDWFDAAGFKAPSSWDEMLEVSKHFAQPGKDVWASLIALKGAYTWPTTRIWDYMMMNGGSLLDPDGKVAFDSPQNVETFEFWKELYKYFHPGSPGFEAGDYRTLFYTEKVAMSWYSRHIFSSDIDKNNPALYGKTDVFLDPPPKKGGKRISRISTDILALSKDSKHPKEALEFLKWLLGFERMFPILQFQQKLGGPGTLLQIINSSKFWEDAHLKKWETIYRKHASFIEFGRMTSAEHHPKVNPMSTTIIGKVLLHQCAQEILIQKTPVKETIKKYAEEMKKVVGK